MALGPDDARAYVYLDGVRLSPSWDVHGVAGVDGIRIKWGRTTPLAKVPPVELTLTLIDPTGAWATTSQPVGKRLEIDAQTDPSPSGGFTYLGSVFRGDITDLAMERVRIADPATGQPTTAWLVTLTALDILADYGQSVVPGDGVGGQWPRETAQARANRLRTLYGVNGVGITSGSGHLLRSHEFADKLSLLDLIETVISDVPGAYINLTPSPINGIDLGSTAPAGGLRLTLTGGTMTLTGTSSAYLIPASRVEIPDTLKLKSSVNNAIDVVNVKWRDSTGADQVVTANTARTSTPSGGKRVWDIDTDMYDAAARAAQVAAAAVVLADSLNDRLEMPPLRINLVGYRTFDALETNVFYAPKTTPKAIAFPGSILNDVPGVGTSFQVIGGTLEYNNGWSHTLNLSPALGAAPVVTLAELVTNPTPTLNDFASDLTLSDLGLITEGLA